MENGDASTRAGPKDGRITLDERTETRGSNKKKLKRKIK